MDLLGRFCGLRGGFLWVVEVGRNEGGGGWGLERERIRSRPPRMSKMVAKKAQPLAWEVGCV